jgi:hypothetical protein
VLSNIAKVALIAALSVLSSPLILVSQDHELPKVEWMAGYSQLRSDGHGLSGWKTAAVGNINQWLGIAADIDGHYFSETGPHGQEEEREHSFTFGPHFALRKHRKLVPVGYTLFGFAHENTLVGGTSHSATGFASELGGALDWEVSKSVAFRVIDCAASITRIEGETHVKPKFGFGVVFNFGH